MNAEGQSEKLRTSGFRPRLRIEAQKVRFGGKTAWWCIRDMQCCGIGLVPSRSAMISDEEGNLWITPRPNNTTG